MQKFKYLERLEVVFEILLVKCAGSSKAKTVVTVPESPVPIILEQTKTEKSFWQRPKNGES